VTPEIYEQQAAFFSALSHPARLRILDILAQSEECVCHLSTVLQQRQAYVSQQLAILKEAGLITDEKDGLYVYYRLADADIVQVLRKARLSLAHISGNETVLHIEVPAHGEIECPCPKCQAKLSHS